MLKKILNAWKILNNDIAIDMGSANTLIMVKGKEGVQLSEPSIVAMKNEDGKKSIVAIGEDAKKLIGRTPIGFEAISPIKHGIIVNDVTATIMIRNFINKVSNSDFLRPNPRVFLAIPASSTEVERRIFKEVLIDAGARDVLLVESPMAAALGAKLPIESEKASMIVNIGAHITEIGVIALKTPIINRTIKVGGQNLDDALINYIKRHDSIKIGLETAERVKINMATALEEEASEDNVMTIRGQLLQSGLPVKIDISKKEVLISMSETFETLIAGIIGVIEELPPEVTADLYECGIVLSGGSANIHGLSTIIEEFTGLKTIVAPEPSLCVIKGLGMVLEMYSKKEY